jgi:outer membrane protein assembly factor BamB
MNASDIAYVGIKGTVLALDRAGGAIIWQTRLKGSEFVNLVAVADDVLALTVGELFCLDAVTGSIKWHNPLKGFGTGLASLLAPGTVQDSVAVLVAELRRREEATRAAAASAGH